MGDSASIDPYGEATGAAQASGASLGSAERPEDWLVDAAVQGDPSAFAALYDRHLDRVYRHCYYCTGNRADAEDLTQQTFLQAWRAIRRYRRGTTPFIAWLLTISHHVAADHFRTRHAVAAAHATPPMTEERTDPEAALTQRLVQDEVRCALLHLNPQHQQVILLRFIEEFSVAETAAALGKTENNIRVIQHRALAHLRRLLEEPGLEHRPVERTVTDRFQSAVAAAVQTAMASLRRS